MFKRQNRQRNRVAAVRRFEERKGLESLPKTTLKAVSGGAFGSWSWRMFNPQPEPPRVRFFGL